MKKLFHILIPMLVLSTLLVSACTGVSAPLSHSGGGKVQAALFAFTGVIDLISADGTEWTFTDGQVITVDPSVVFDGPFVVGDTVRVEVDVQPDGSIVVTRVGIPDAADILDENDSDDGQVDDDDGDNNDTDDDQVDDDDGDNNNTDDDQVGDDDSDSGGGS